MSPQPQDDSVAVIPSREDLSPSPAATQPPSTTTPNYLFGTITKTIGTGENAKNSIVWMTITWSFSIATGITGALIFFIGVAYFQNKLNFVPELNKTIGTTWAIFSPIITLALGYAFGRNETK